MFFLFAIRLKFLNTTGVFNLKKDTSIFRMRIKERPSPIIHRLEIRTKTTQTQRRIRRFKHDVSRAKRRGRHRFHHSDFLPLKIRFNTRKTAVTIFKICLNTFIQLLFRVKLIFTFTQIALIFSTLFKIENRSPSIIIEETRHLGNNRSTLTIRQIRAKHLATKSLKLNRTLNRNQKKIFHNFNNILTFNNKSFFFTLPIYNCKFICPIIYIMINRQSREIYEDEYLLETER